MNLKIQFNAKARRHEVAKKNRMYFFASLRLSVFALNCIFAQKQQQRRKQAERRKSRLERHLERHLKILWQKERRLCIAGVGATLRTRDPPKALGRGAPLGT